MPVSFYPSSHRLPNDAGQLITGGAFSSLSPLYGLVALTENFLKPGLSFPFKGKKNSMTVSIVISGGIAYQDQLGNAAKVYAGQSLLTYNQEEALQWFLNLSDKISVSFVQLQFHAPSSPFPPYQKSCFTAFTTVNHWQLIACQNGKEEILSLQQPINIYLAKLEAKQSITIALQLHCAGWLQILEGKVELEKRELHPGDGVKITDGAPLVLKALTEAKLLLIELEKVGEKFYNQK